MKKFKFEDFDIDFRVPLGEGAYGAVYKATEKKSKEVYAIKRILIENLNEHEIEQIEDEITSMRILKKYENSINYFGYFKEKEKFIYLIMELCDCNLQQIIKEKKGKLNAEEIKEILKQLNNVFKIMHEK